MEYLELINLIDLLSRYNNERFNGENSSLIELIDYVKLDLINLGD